VKKVIVVLALLCVGVFGCNKGQTVQQDDKQAGVNAETLTLKEADKLLAQPTTGTTNQQVAAVTANVANVVVNNEAGPLADVNTTAAATVSSQASSEGPDGKLIQQALKNAGFYSGNVDGTIGPKSREAIRDFQRKNNLHCDGKVGPKTWAAMKGFLGQSEEVKKQ
jgi:peptidoglycan hydrolase-like protein with peptidoglycan-binding domain